jgi:hypothetical protein
VLAAATLIVAPAGARAVEDHRRMLSVSERTENGGETSYPDAAVVDIDVNSSVVVHLVPEALAGLSPSRSAATDRADLVRKLRQLEAIQEKLNQAAAAVAAQARVRIAADEQGIQLAGEALKSYQDAYRALSNAYKSVQSYDKARFAAVVADSSDPILGTIRFIAQEQQHLQEQVREDVEDAPVRFLTITAYIGDPTRQLHVPGYDDLTPGSPRLIEKTRFTFDERFQEEYAAAKALARNAADWNKLRAAAEEAIRRKLTEIAAELKTLAASSAALATKAETDPLPAVKNAAKDLRAAATSIQEAVTLATPALDAAVHPSPDADPAVLLAAAVNALQGSAPKFEAAAKALVAAFQQLQTAGTALAAEAGKLANGAAQLAARALGSKIAAAPQLPTIRVKIEEARDTEISLLGTNRADGDVLTITGRVLERTGEQDVLVPGGEITTHLRVRSRGFVADTGAVVLFVRPVRHDPGPFVPAAGAFAVYRFKGWRGGGEAHSSFWYYTAPGLGVSAVAIPRSSDGSTQLAWMGTFHLFGDVLQASIGTTTDAEPVWGVGIGLHRIAGLGKYFQ